MIDGRIIVTILRSEPVQTAMDSHHCQAMDGHPEERASRRERLVVVVGMACPDSLLEYVESLLRRVHPFRIRPFIDNDL